MLDILPVDWPGVSLRDRVRSFQVDIVEREFFRRITIPDCEAFVFGTMERIGDQGQIACKSLAKLLYKLVAILQT